MAIFIPTLQQIQQAKVTPEPGEIHLLNFLSETLDDTFEVFFNPYMNGDRPDIVIMKKGQGILIVEVKDYNLDHYELDNRKNWRVKSRGGSYTIKSPISQVLRYKENIFNLHVEKLLNLKIKDIRHFNTVSCCVYFHNATETKIKEFLVDPFMEDQKYKDFLKYNVDFLGRDSLNSEFFSEFLKKRYMISARPSIFFTDVIYKSCSLLLKPPMHLKEDGKHFIYSPEQQRIIYEQERNELRVKGVMGSGKTSVLAARAVELYKRTRGNVLILTYNITLRNFIKDKISMIREEFPWSAFQIMNYHVFINAELNNIGIDVVVPEGFSSYDEYSKSKYFEREYYSNENLFENFSSELLKYDVILIDEIQDYRREWMNILKKYFLNEGGEYMVFGDAKQNIYDSELLGKDVAVNITGAPRQLKHCFRSDFKVKNLAVEFQKEFFSEKYEIDAFNQPQDQSEIPFETQLDGYLNYIHLTEPTLPMLYNIIKENSVNKGIPLNDITILGQTISKLRDFDAFYRYSSNEKTNTMFEKWESIFTLGFNFVKSQNLHWLQEGFSLIKRGNDFNKTKAVEELSKLFTLKKLFDEFPEIFENKIEFICNQFRTTKEEFNRYFSKNKFEIEKFNESFSPSRLKSELKNIRENKKLHFYFNSGTVKISTVHSFKGWESDMVFLLIEPKYQYSSFDKTFDEILYTGITRCRSNLVIINLNNKDYHLKIKNLIDRTR